MRQIAEFEWDNPNNNIDITNRTEINDLFWRATEEYGFEYVETDEQLKDFVNQGKIVVDKNKITFFE